MLLGFAALSPAYCETQCAIGQLVGDAATRPTWNAGDFFGKDVRQAEALIFSQEAFCRRGFSPERCRDEPDQAKLGLNPSYKARPARRPCAGNAGAQRSGADAPSSSTSASNSSSARCAPVSRFPAVPLRRRRSDADWPARLVVLAEFQRALRPPARRHAQRDQHVAAHFRPTRRFRGSLPRRDPSAARMSAVVGAGKAFSPGYSRRTTRVTRRLASACRWR